MGKQPPIRVLDLAGTPTAMGAAHGAAYADEIRFYMNERVDIVRAGMWKGGPLQRGDVLDIAESMIPAHEAFDAHLHDEMCALADAADITVAEAIVAGGFTDFIDTVRAVVGGVPPAAIVEDDCTAVIVPDNRAEGTGGYFGQTWDMHDVATKHVLLLRITPDDAPPAIVFTTTGCLGQIGMNADGVCVGINNLSGLDGTRGVTWTSVVRNMLKTQTADEALQILLDADLAGAHNFLIFDRHGVGHNVEAMPSVRPITALADAPIVHTNHTLDPAATKVQAPRDPRQTANSEQRLETGRKLLAEGTIDEERIFELTREPDAICRVPTEPFHIESSGAAVMRPSTGDFWACWGRPSENDYQHIPFA